MHKYPKASAGIQNVDKLVHAYVLQRRTVGYAERGWFCRLSCVSLFRCNLKKAPLGSLAAQPSNAPEKVSPNPIDPERSRTPSAWRRSML
jgi:hypothetical protein